MKNNKISKTPPNLGKGEKSGIPFRFTENFKAKGIIK
jgi:hypothetical protein